MATQVGRDDVGIQKRRDLVPAVREIEKAVDEDERRVAGRFPFENVVAKPGGEREPASVQGPASR
jgi:hypothetical protein